MDHTYEGRRAMAVYYTSVDCNPPTPLLRSVVDFCTTCFYSWAAVDKISSDTARRVVRLQ